MALPDGVRDVLAKFESQGARWLLVAVGVIILIRLRLILFAAALPVMAYYHYSSQAEEDQPAAADADADDRAATGTGGTGHPEDEEGEEEDLLDDEDGEVEGGRPAPMPPAAAAAAARGGQHGHPPTGGGGEALWPDDDDPLLCDGGRRGHDREAADPYDQSFWGDSGGGGAAADAKRNASWRNNAKPDSRKGADHGGFDDPLRFGDDDDLGGGAPVKAPPRGRDKDSGLDPWDTGGDLDDMFPSGPATSRGGAQPRPRPGTGTGGGGFAGGGGGFGGGGGGARGGGAGGLDDFDFLGSGPDLDMFGGARGGHSGGFDDDMDFLGGGFGGGFGGRGKGKGKGGGKKGDKGDRRDPMAPREPDPKQVFVANVGDMPEEDIRVFFEEVGEVDRLKVLRNPDGSSKGVCFVTFATVEQAQKALTLHGQHLDGRSLVVRLAHGGNKGTEKGGGFKGGGYHHSSDGPLDLGGSERFGAAFGAGAGGGFGGGDRDHRDKGGGKGGRGGKGGLRRNDRGEMDELLEEALADGDGPLKPADFDFAARRFLTELRNRDRVESTERFPEALEMVLKYTSTKDRSSVRKWPAYVFTLLQKFDPGLWEELRERDAERRAGKGAGGGFGGPRDFGGPREPRPRDD